MSAPDTQEKMQSPEKPSAGEAVAGKAEIKSSSEALHGLETRNNQVNQQNQQEILISVPLALTPQKKRFMLLKKS